MYLRARSRLGATVSEGAGEVLGGSSAEDDRSGLDRSIARTGIGGWIAREPAAGRKLGVTRALTGNPTVTIIAHDANRHTKPDSS